MYKRQAFSRKSAYDKDVIWHVPIRGVYQVMNAELALEAMEYALSLIHIYGKTAVVRPHGGACKTGN